MPDCGYQSLRSLFAQEGLRSSRREKGKYKNQRRHYITVQVNIKSFLQFYFKKWLLNMLRFAPKAWMESIHVWMVHLCRAFYTHGPVSRLIVLSTSLTRLYTYNTRFIWCSDTPLYLALSLRFRLLLFSYLSGLRYWRLVICAKRASHTTFAIFICSCYRSGICRLWHKAVRGRFSAVQSAFALEHGKSL